MVTYVIPSGVVTVREYLDEKGHSPFGRWKAYRRRKVQER